MDRSRRCRLGAITLVTAFLISTAACGAQQGDDTVAARRPPPAATTTTVPLTSARLESGLLMAADLPRGFDVETRGDHPDGLAGHLTAAEPACQPALDELAPDGGDGMPVPSAAVSYERGQVARVSEQVSQSADAVERFRNARRILHDRCGGVVTFRIDGGSGRYLLRAGPRIGDETIYLRSHLRTRIHGALATIDGFDVFVRVGDVVSTVTGHAYRIPALGLAAQRRVRFADAVALTRRATRRLRRALR